MEEVTDIIYCFWECITGLGPRVYPVSRQIPLVLLTSQDLEGKDPTGLTVLTNFKVVVEEYKSPQLATKVGLAANSSFEVGDF